MNDTTRRQRSPGSNDQGFEPSAGGQQGFQHHAWLADGPNRFGDAVVDLLRSSEASSAVVVTPAARHEEVRSALPDDLLEPRYVDVDAAVRNPARLVDIWLEALADADGGRVLGINESVHHGRGASELVEAHGVDRLLSLAIPSASNLLLTCVYDTASLASQDVGRAWDAHASVMGVPGGPDDPRPEPLDLAPFAAPMLDEAPREARVVEVQDMAALAEVRRVVLEVTQAAGLDRGRSDDVALAANELAANSVRHGGGHGLLLVWRTDEAVVVQSVDGGSITDPLAGLRRPDPTRPSGRGLWIVNQVSDLVQRRSTPDGLATRATFRLRPGAGGAS